ncbi:unnamed protein product [Rotaria magnacalcarata]|uniref:Uncharacterized protein n=1 Tax=Rotaria magnacalcarata TaxID=392030 RepID=A0A815VIZ2_9BILA|nr:unnamed protein product [Rotaria magnacalcarata]CAF4722883.1 unnamed protein product [Rotaria magnacalcarata]
MGTLQFLFIFVVVSCTTALFCGDKVNVQFDTKYDNNHNELKQLLAEYKTFTPSNWTHYVLLIQLLIACRGKRLKNRINDLTSITTSYIQPPYGHTPNPVINQQLHSPLNQIVS